MNNWCVCVCERLRKTKQVDLVKLGVIVLDILGFYLGLTKTVYATNEQQDLTFKEIVEIRYIFRV